MTNDNMDDWMEKEKLHFAAHDGNLEAVKRLVQAGFPLNAFDEISKTPLHYAAENGHIEVVKFLIEAGADVNAHEESKIGNTPLREIAGNCSYEMAKIFVDAGSDPTIPGWMQITALHTASKRKRGDGPRIYELLQKAKRNSKNRK